MKSGKQGPRHGNKGADFVLGNPAYGGMELGGSSASGDGGSSSGAPGGVVYGREAALSHMITDLGMMAPEAGKLLDKLSQGNPNAEFVIEGGRPSVWKGIASRARSRAARSRDMLRNPHAVDGGYDGDRQ